MVASIQIRIHQWLQSQRRSKSKIKENQKPSHLVDFTRLKSGNPVGFQGGAVWAAMWASIRAGELELEAGKQAGSWKL